jgi:hypothetical protein
VQGTDPPDPALADLETNVMIVTIARDIGSHGEDVGRAVASLLGVSFFDHEIIARAARIAKVSEQAIEQAERAPSLLSRMIEALGRYPAGFELAEAASALQAPPLSSDSYRHFVEEVIRGLAAGSGGVIIGHAAQVLLRDAERTRAVHVRVCAPWDARVRAVAAEEGINTEEARRRTKQSDQERAEYYQRYYGVNWRDPALYDLTLNTARMRIGTAADIIAGVVRDRQR